MHHSKCITANMTVDWPLRVRTDKTPCEHNESGYASIADVGAALCRLCCKSRNPTTGRLRRQRRSRNSGGDHGDLPANQISRERRQLIILTLGPAVFDRHVAALGKAGFAQSLTEGGNVDRERSRATHR